MAYEAYGKCKFDKQGASAGTSPRDSHKDEFPFIRFQYEVLAAFDVSTNKAKGKRQHKNIILTKEWDATTVQFWSACTTNEKISSFDMSFFQKDKNGKDEHYYHITLVDAHIVKVRQYTGTAEDEATGANAKSPGVHDTMELEDISISFNKITVEHKLSNKVQTDAWNEDQAS